MSSVRVWILYFSTDMYYWKVSRYAVGGVFMASVDDLKKVVGCVKSQKLEGEVSLREFREVRLLRGFEY